MTQLREVKSGELENCTMEQRKIKTLLHDDVVYQILQWLPVTSLLRFKLVCRTWRALIESTDFIKQHLHHHHYDPNLKDKNHSLIHLDAGEDSPFTFPLISVDSFEEPNTCVRLDNLDLHQYSARILVDIVSYNGIVCLDLLNRKLEHSICLWNPATKQSRVLPQPPALNIVPTTVGFGFDVKSNEYKVVNLSRNGLTDEKRVEVYSLNTGAWRSLNIVFPFSIFVGNPRMPFNNGTCFFWLGENSPKNKGIICFDFSSETFRTIPLPCAGWRVHTSVVRDNIACAISTNDYLTEMWVFNEYGTVNESWTKLYTIDNAIRIEWVSMDGNYVFFRRSEQMCRFNVVTKETNCFTSESTPCSFYKCTMVEFKESLVSVVDP